MVIETWSQPLNKLISFAWRCTVFFTDTFYILFQVMEKLISVQLSLNTFQVLYSHEQVYSWLSTHLQKPQSYQVPNNSL